MAIIITRQKNYKKAISFYLKAIENKKKFGHHAADINMKISKLYGIIEDHDKEKLYLKMSSEQRITDENKKQNRYSGSFKTE